MECAGDRSVHELRQRLLWQYDRLVDINLFWLMSTWCVRYACYACCVCNVGMFMHVYENAMVVVSYMQVTPASLAPRMRQLRSVPQDSIVQVVQGCVLSAVLGSMAAVPV